MRVMIYAPAHPNVALSDWHSFREGFPPRPISEVIDRSEILLPDWFVPLARGVAIASKDLLHSAAYYPGQNARPAGARPSVTFCQVCTG